MDKDAFESIVEGAKQAASVSSGKEGAGNCYNFPTWGTKVVLTHKGIWGHDAYQQTYTFSGCLGKFPQYTYRFTLCGEGSIYSESFKDLVFKSEDFYEGHQTSLVRIDKIVSANDPIYRLNAIKEALSIYNTQGFIPPHVAVEATNIIDSLIVEAKPND